MREKKAGNPLLLRTRKAFVAAGAPSKQSEELAQEKICQHNKQPSNATGYHLEYIFTHEHPEVMDISIITASIGSFVLSERVIKVSLVSQMNKPQHM